MTIAHVAFRGSATDKASSTTLAMSPTATLAVGEEVFVAVAANNTATADGDSTEITLADSSGNTWTEVYEKTNSAGAAADGVTVALYRSRIATQITTGGTITATFATAIVAKTISCHAFSASSALASAGTPGFAFVDAGASRDVTISDLDSGAEVLIVWVGGIETNTTQWTTAGTTFDGDYTLSGGIISTTGGGAGSNVSHQVAFRIVTGITSDTFTITSPPANEAVYAIVGAVEAGVTVSGAQASETDTPNAGTATVVLAGGLATETETANAGVPRVTMTGALASESDTANAGAAVVVVAGNLATETDTANAGTAGQVVPGSQASETDTAQSGTALVVVDGGLASETDTANAGAALVGVVVAGSLATETDTANGGAVLVLVAGSQASETDTANAGSGGTTGGIAPTGNVRYVELADASALDLADPSRIELAETA